MWQIKIQDRNSQIFKMEFSGLELKSRTDVSWNPKWEHLPDIIKYLAPGVKTGKETEAENTTWERKETNPPGRWCHSSTPSLESHPVPPRAPTPAESDITNTPVSHALILTGQTWRVQCLQTLEWRHIYFYEQNKQLFSLLISLLNFFLLYSTKCQK